mgnify:CR=1 FL=1
MCIRDRVYGDEALDVIRQKVTAVAEYVVDYVGIDLRLDGLSLIHISEPTRPY